MKHKALSQLLAAAVINERFREMLLKHPARAIAMGYSGQPFSLTFEEQELVEGIHADRLEDFAAEIYRWISGNDRDGSLSAADQPHIAPVSVVCRKPILDSAQFAVAA